MDFIKRALEQAYPEISVEHKKRESKLIITNKKAFVKVEVNQIKRGCYTVPEYKKLCIQAQEEFEAWSGGRGAFSFQQVQIIKSTLAFIY